MSCQAISEKWVLASCRDIFCLLKKGSRRGGGGGGGGGERKEKKKRKKEKKSFVQSDEFQHPLQFVSHFDQNISSMVCD